MRWFFVVFYLFSISCSNLYRLPAGKIFKVRKMSLSGNIVYREIPYYTVEEINCFQDKADRKIISVSSENSAYVIPHFYGEVIDLSVEVDKWPIDGRYTIRNGFIIHELYESVNASYRINEGFQVETADCSYGLNGFVRGEKAYYRSFRKVDN